MPTASEIQGLADLVKKLTALRDDFNGPPINKTCQDAAKLIAQEAKRNIKRGPTGNLLKAVQVVRGKKAWKYGAVAIARINAWLAPHAHLIEAGTKSYSGLMKVPLSAVSQEWWMKLTTAQRIEAGKRGFLFISTRTGVVAQHPFQKAVEAKLEAVTQLMRDGCKQITENATK